MKRMNKVKNVIVAKILRGNRCTCRRGMHGKRGRELWSAYPGWKYESGG